LTIIDKPAGEGPAWLEHVVTWWEEWLWDGKKIFAGKVWYQCKGTSSSLLWSKGQTACGELCISTRTYVL